MKKRWILLLVFAVMAVLVGLAFSPAFAVLPGGLELRFLAKEVYYFGNEHQCNICGRPLRKFKKGVSFLAQKLNPTSQGELECPFCWSYPRHRTTFIYFKERTNLFDGKPKRMLHVAPECLAEKFRKARYIDYLSADLDPVTTGAMVKMDITDIHYPDNSFDVIYCSHVLEHVPEDRKAMRELARVLKPTGWAVLAVPIMRQETFEDPKITSPADRLRVYGQEDHVRAYGQDFADRLRESGFDVTVDPFARGLSEEMVQRYGLSREDIYFCHKHPIR
jgi:hypothetical protein